MLVLLPPISVRVESQVVLSGNNTALHVLAVRPPPSSFTSQSLRFLVYENRLLQVLWARNMSDHDSAFDKSSRCYFGRTYILHREMSENGIHVGTHDLKRWWHVCSRWERKPNKKHPIPEWEERTLDMTIISSLKRPWILKYLWMKYHEICFKLLQQSVGVGWGADKIGKRDWLKPPDRRMSGKFFYSLLLLIFENFHNQKPGAGDPAIHEW